MYLIIYKVVKLSVKFNSFSFYNDFDLFVFLNNTFFLVPFTSYYFGIKLFTLLFIAQALIVIFIRLHY